MAYRALNQHDGDESSISSRSTYSEEDDDQRELHDSPTRHLFLAGSRYDALPYYHSISQNTGSLEGHCSEGEAQVEKGFRIKRERSNHIEQQNITTTTTPTTKLYQPVAQWANIPAIPATPATQATPSPRSTSLRSVSVVSLRHPTPDLSMPGSQLGNIEHLEKTAERLSMNSDMAAEIRKMHAEQKRSDSLKSSLLTCPEPRAVNKQFSANSIVEINSTARSGGYSPGGYMISPKSSISNRGRSASKSSRYSSRPEPEHEGRPLDSFVNSFPPLSPVDSRASSFAEGAEMSTMARVLAGTNVASQLLESHHQATAQPILEHSDRPTTSASTSTIEQAQKMFQDFDGVHSHHFEVQSGAIPAAESDNNFINSGKNPSLGGLRVISNVQRAEVDDISNSVSPRPRNEYSSVTSAARPPTYVHLKTGQQMVYYPAPVPAVLNAPPKMYSRPQTMSQDANRPSQTQNNVPEGSAAWLPHLSENTVDSTLRVDGGGKPEEMGTPESGNKAPQQANNMPPIPPQLSGIAHYKHPDLDKRMGRKKPEPQNLDTILDASVNAPVDAFVGPDGKPKPGVEAVVGEKKKKKRSGSFGNWLTRASGLEDDTDTIATDLSVVDIQKVKEKDPDKRRSMLTISTGKEDEDSQHYVCTDRGDDEGQFENEEITGPPTTLLAELQFRKQQAKQRVQSAVTKYPNGMHSTLLELDTVAEMEKRARGHRPFVPPRPGAQDDDEDEDVPLGVLYPGQTVSQPRQRPKGLLFKRELEDNEPLSKRRERLQAGAATRRASSASMLQQTTQHLPLPGEDPNKRESHVNMPVSGEFASELMSQFGVDENKDKGRGKTAENRESRELAPEEEESLGQRKARLRAERQAREAEVGAGVRAAGTNHDQKGHLRQKKSMADIIGAYPASGGRRESPTPRLIVERTSSYEMGAGLLAMHEKESKRRSSALSIDFAKALPKPLLQSTQKQANRASSLTIAAIPHNRAASMTMAGAGGMGMTAPAPPATSHENSHSMQPHLFVAPNMGGANQMGMQQQQQQQQQNQQQMMMAGYAGFPAAYGYVPQMLYMGMMPMAYGTPMPMLAPLGMGMQQMQMPLNQNQLDMVERWRQGVSQ